MARGRRWIGRWGSRGDRGRRDLSDASVRCLGRGEVTLEAQAAGLVAVATVRCHPDARVVPPGPVRLAVGDPPVAVGVVDGDQDLDVPLTLRSTDPEVVEVDGPLIRPVGPGATGVEVRAAGLHATIPIVVAAPLPRGQIYLVDAQGSLLVVDPTGGVTTLAALEGYEREASAVLLDLDRARVGWIHGGEAWARGIGPGVEPAEVLGPVAPGSGLGLDAGGFVRALPGGGQVLTADGPVALPDSARFVGTDASMRPCATTVRGRRLWCHRDEGWVAQPNGRGAQAAHPARFVRLLDGGTAAEWDVAIMGKCTWIDHPITPHRRDRIPLGSPVAQRQRVLRRRHRRGAGGGAALRVPHPP